MVYISKEWQISLIKLLHNIMNPNLGNSYIIIGVWTSYFIFRNANIGGIDRTIIKLCNTFSNLALLNYTNVIMCFIIIWHWSNIPSVWCLIWYYLIMFHDHHLFMHGGYNSEWTSMNSHWSKHNTFFCLKQCIHMNQLYELSVSMCSVAWLAPTHYINSVETYLKQREMKICFAKRRMSHFRSLCFYNELGSF